MRDLRQALMEKEGDAPCDFGSASCLTKDEKWCYMSVAKPLNAFCIPFAALITLKRGGGKLQWTEEKSLKST